MSRGSLRLYVVAPGTCVSDECRFVGSSSAICGRCTAHSPCRSRTLTLYPARGQSRRRSDKRVYVRKSGPKLRVARPGLGSAVSTASTATWQEMVGLLQRGNALDSPALHEILGRVQYLANQFDALLTSAMLHASLRGYKNAGGDPLSLPAPRSCASRRCGSSEISRS